MHVALASNPSALPCDSIRMQHSICSKRMRSRTRIVRTLSGIQSRIGSSCSNPSGTGSSTLKSRCCRIWMFAMPPPTAFICGAATACSLRVGNEGLSRMLCLPVTYCPKARPTLNSSVEQVSLQVPAGTSRPCRFLASRK